VVKEINLSTEEIDDIFYGNIKAIIETEKETRA